MKYDTDCRLDFTVGNIAFSWSDYDVCACLVCCVCHVGRMGRMGTCCGQSEAFVTWVGTGFW